jgi:hypothetical protein
LLRAFEWDACSRRAQDAARAKGQLALDNIRALKASRSDTAAPASGRDTP